MKRLAFGIMILAAVIVSGCTSSGNGDMIIVSDGSVIDQQVCHEKGLDAEVVVFHSPTCPVCRQTVPVLEEVENEVNVPFVFIDLSVEREKAEELGIMPTHIPTALINCRAYAGYKDKETFINLIEGG